MEKPIITIKTKPSFFGGGTIFLIIISAICLYSLEILGSSPGGEAGMMLDAMKVIIRIPLAISAFLLIIVYYTYSKQSAKWHKQKNHIEEYKIWIKYQSDLAQNISKDTHTEPENS